MMSCVSGVEAMLPPGFRFHPRDDEIICDYLLTKLSPSPCPLLSEVDLNKCEPWDLPPTTCVGGKEWYFYSHLGRKYATGSRTNRATSSGYWKATGKDRAISRNGSLVGMRKTLVFYRGRAPKGRKTDWVMHEFRAEGSSLYLRTIRQDVWVLCRVLYKNGGRAAAKPGLEGPLMDTDPTCFDPTSTCHYEQVPCFSNFTVESQFGLLQDMYSEGITDSGSSLEPGDGMVLRGVLSEPTWMDSSNPGSLLLIDDHGKEE